VTLKERLVLGRQVQRDKQKAEEATKLGNLRAGNSGAMSPEGEVVGSCHRRAHLRQLGIEVEEHSDTNLLMFSLGTANEDIVYNDLMQTKAENEIILRETEIPVKWLTKNGTNVTGRPDMVICERGEDGAARPKFGIELKSVASVWTTKDVLFDNNPKMEHLIQSSHYAWRLGVPFLLMYKQYANQVVPSWAGKMFPRKGEANSEHVEYNDKGEVKYIKPFEIVYQVEADKNGRIKYRRETEDGSAEWVRTLVKVDDIERFYEFVSTMPEKQELGPRPLALTPTGDKKSYSACTYCPVKSTCDKTEKQGYNPWLEAVKKEVEKIRSERESQGSGGNERG
jgi:hypothetical protein